MFRKLLMVAALLAGACGIQGGSLYALGGNLERPSISIPTTGLEGKLDPVVEAMHKVLTSQEKQFAGGHFINAHSVLHYGGGTKTINALLDGLAKVEGGVVRIRFEKGPGVARQPFSGKQQPEKPCDCSIDHNAWANAREMTVTIHLGGDIDIDELVVPPFEGREKSLSK
jgi:hypothetical protein